MTCTTEGCGRDTSLYLCTACIIAFDDLLKEVPDLLGRLDEVRAGTAVVKTSGGGGGHAGSKPPGSLNALQLQAWLCTLPERAHTAAHDYPDAGEWLYMARIWVPNARELCWGYQEPKVDHEANRRKLEKAAPPMPARDFMGGQSRATWEQLESNQPCTDLQSALAPCLFYSRVSRLGPQLFPCLEDSTGQPKLFRTISGARQPFKCRARCSQCQRDW